MTINRKDIQWYGPAVDYYGIQCNHIDWSLGDEGNDFKHCVVDDPLQTPTDVCKVHIVCDE